MTQKERTVPAPATNPETQPFWDAAQEGRFLLKWCADCGKAHWYPRAVCPFCFSSRTEWREASGKATIYSYSVMRRAPEVFAVAYVTLEEGPTMLTNLRDWDFDRLSIGQPVRLVFSPTDGGPPVPMFAPV
jgi:uncharacterized OB-fold protein